MKKSVMIVSHRKNKVNLQVFLAVDSCEKLQVAETSLAMYFLE